MAHELNAISVSGNLLSNEFLHTSRLPGGKFSGFDPNTFNPDWTKDADFEASLSQTWQSLLERYDSLRLELFTLSPADLRRRWTVPLFKSLGFDPKPQKLQFRIEGTELSFPISHRGWSAEGAPAVHIFPLADNPDIKPPERGSKSPQMLLQTYLNQNREEDWAILSNGHVIRLLRDYYHTSQPGYVQFDLFQLFDTRDFDEFRSLFRLAHASRFLAAEADLSEVIDPKPETSQADTDEDAEVAEPVELTRPESKIMLERYFEHSKAEGSRAETSLRQNVRAALETLGNGLLSSDLRSQLEDSERLEDYYRQLLRVIYRCIFLLFAEQRGLVPSIQKAGDGAFAELYRSEYSLTALRNLAESSRNLRDDAHDLWERLLITFKLAQEGNSELGVPAFNSQLFDPSSIYLIYGETRDPKVRNTLTHLPKLSNTQTLEFISHLAFTSTHGALERINYRDLKVEEIGHIYESLLDYAPRIATQDTVVDNKEVRSGAFYLDPKGQARKTSGSYYTPRELVQELISRTLIPVIESRLKEASTLKEQEDALLNIKILDPACGSGAFLIAANDALAKQLADLRWSGETSHKEGDYQRTLETAKRDVLQHCIYGVDLNDMAIELAKVALWINAASSGKPLNFLDHRIKCGNSLVGAPLNFYQLGISADAYKGRNDSDPEMLKEVRKIFPAKDLKNWRDNPPPLQTLHIMLPNLDTIKEDDLLGVQAKELTYQTLKNNETLNKWQDVADYWTAAFFYPVQPQQPHIPNQKGLTTLITGIEERSLAQQHNLTPLHPQTKAQISVLARRHRFFHYWLEFPEVFFERQGKLKDSPGFDVILGNPPWERVKLQEQEFFAVRDEEVAQAANAAKRKKMIEELKDKNPKLFQDFQDALNDADASSNFLRVSGRYPLGGVGDVNTYQVFTENARDLTSANGRTGIIVPSGIATDNTTKDLFRDFVERRSLVSLDDFENREGLFQGVHRSYKFCSLILTAPGSGPEAAEFSFFNTRISHLNDLSRKFQLTPEDFRRINPNTLTCPTFRTGRDAEITLMVHSTSGVFMRESENLWDAEVRRVFDMNKFVGSPDCKTYAELPLSIPTALKESFYPVYEAKLIGMYNHRFATYAEGKSVVDINVENLCDLISPRFWISTSEVVNALNRYENKSTKRKWIIAYRDVTRATDTRTTIASIIPLSATDYTVRIIQSTMPTKKLGSLLANFNSIVFDYIARQAVAGIHLSDYIVKQLPVLPPSHYQKPHLTYIIPRVLELTYTAWDIKAFADDLWREADADLRKVLEAQWQANGGHTWEPPDWAEIEKDGFPFAPFKWNEVRRAELRAELDALYAHLYGLSRDELLWILDPRDVDPKTPSVTFPGLRRNEEKQFGEYRTKRLVLKYFDELVEAEWLAQSSVKEITGG